MTSSYPTPRNPGHTNFMGEGNFPHGSMFGSVGLLSSYGELAPRKSVELFEAGRQQDIAPLFRLQHEFETFGADLWAAPRPGPHMDGAYDKMVVKLGMLPEFPLRLLSPYQGFTEDDFRAIRRVMDERYADWVG